MKIKFNESIKTGLNLATGVLFELDDMGVTVLDVEVDGGRAVVTVDRAPASGRPAHAITRNFNGARVTLHTAELRGCKIQWQTQMSGSAAA